VRVLAGPAAAAAAAAAVARAHLYVMCASWLVML
jgi:hypothetical protein